MARRRVADALDDAQIQLVQAGVPSARHDSEVLLAHALDVDRSGIARLMVMDAWVDAEHVAAFDALVEQRARRIPLQHLTGEAPFRHIELAVGPGVFVPRPETEVVAGFAIEAAITMLHDATGPPAPVRAAASSGAGPMIVDLCAGSGAIALSVAHEVPSSTVHAVELDDDAVLWLRRNAEGFGNVTVHHANACRFVPVELIGRVDVVVSNPPYIPDNAVIRDPEVAQHDPALALWGGPDGLDVVRRLREVAVRLLRPGGVLVIEHADVQGEAMPAVLREHIDDSGHSCWDAIVDHPDLAGRPRFTSSLRQADLVVDSPIATVSS